MNTNNQLNSKKSIEWRRNFILNKLARGWSQQNIADELHLDKSTISKDCKFISDQVQRDLKDHVDRKVTMRYLQSDIGLQAVLKKAWEIIDDPNSKRTEVIQTLSLISNTYDKLMELSTNAEVVSKSLAIIERVKAEILRREAQLEQSKSQTKSDSNTEQEEKEEETENMSEYKF